MAAASHPGRFDWGHSGLKIDSRTKIQHLTQASVEYNTASFFMQANHKFVHLTHFSAGRLRYRDTKSKDDAHTPNV